MEAELGLAKRSDLKKEKRKGVEEEKENLWE